MIRTVLVPVSGDRTDDDAHWCALTVGRLFGTHLDFLFVRADPSVALMAASGDIAGGPAFSELLVDREREDQERAERARRAFENFCARERIDIVGGPPGPHGVSAAWQEEKGDEAALVTWRARFNDLLVASRPGEEEGLSPETAEAALMASGRPILLAPSGRVTSLTRTIIIAWKDTAEAARAVTAAMPLLKRADRIVVASVREADGQDNASAQTLAEQLRWHHLDAEARSVAPDLGSAPQSLVQLARDLKAELIVMGGYGHSRVREVIFGGFTRHMLERSNLPVLMAH